MEKMKAYFGAMRRLQPQLSDDANTVLTRYYQLQRRSSGRNPARTTIRMLESLSRLAEGEEEGEGRGGERREGKRRREGGRGN